MWCAALFGFVGRFSHRRAADVDWVRVGTSGKTIVFLFKDQPEDKAFVENIAAHPTITVNGQAAVPLGDPIYEKAARMGTPYGLPYIVYPLFGRTLKPGDKVTVSAVAGWRMQRRQARRAWLISPSRTSSGQSLLRRPRRARWPSGSTLAPRAGGRQLSRNLLRGLPTTETPRAAMMSAFVPTACPSWARRGPSCHGAVPGRHGGRLHLDVGRERPAGTDRQRSPENVRAAHRRPGQPARLHGEGQEGCRRSRE